LSLEWIFIFGEIISFWVLKKRWNESMWWTCERESDRRRRRERSNGGKEGHLMNLKFK